MRSRRSTAWQEPVRTSSEDEPPTEQDKELFQRALHEALEASEIAATLDRAPADESSYLRELTMEAINKLWDEITEERLALESVEGELSRLRERTRHPVGWVVHNVVTVPQLQIVLATGGLLLIALAFALPFLGTSYSHSIFGRVATFLGLLILVASTIGGLVSLLRTRTSREPQGVGNQLQNATVGLTLVGFAIATSTDLLRISASLPNLGPNSGNVVRMAIVIVAGILMLSSVLLIR
jgi:hypothetical protein